MFSKRTMLGATAALALSTGAAMAVPAVTEADLNMRTGPGTGYDVITAIPGGAAVDVMGCSGGWCEVAWGGAVGYSSRSYLDLAGPVARTTTTIVTPPAVYATAPLYGGFADYGYDYYDAPRVGFSFGFDNRPAWRGNRGAVRREVRQDRREWRRDVRQDRREMRSDRRENRREARAERRRDRRD